MIALFTCLIMSFEVLDFDMKKPRITEAFSIFGAGNEIRTRDPNLGKVVLYQLSYSRLRWCVLWRNS